jgi:ORF6N domain
MSNVVRAVESKIMFLRGEKVLLGPHLAELYGVEPRALVQAVKRNAERFPVDFMFQLSREEWESLKSQTVISNQRGGVRTAPYAFTEQGVAMLSSVLNSKQAIAVNIEIMRTFVKLRRIMTEHADLSRKLSTLERKYDTKFKMVFDAIRELMAPPVKPARRIGFKISVRQ